MHCKRCCQWRHTAHAGGDFQQTHWHAVNMSCASVRTVHVGAAIATRLTASKVQHDGRYYHRLCPDSAGQPAKVTMMRTRT